MVLWCLCCTASLVVVEQPDTIVYDWGAPEGVQLLEFRTSALGDASDKFVRLAVRGVHMPELDSRGEGERRKRRRRQQGRSQFAFADADERDRARSTWAHHPRTCARLADLPALARVPLAGAGTPSVR